MNPNEVKELKEIVTKLGSELATLKGAFYKNNFSSSQQFNKDVSFNSRLRVPVFSSAPTIAEIGDLVAISGVLYICTTASVSGAGAVFTAVGTQS